MGKGREKGGGAGKKEKEGNFLSFYFSCSRSSIPRTRLSRSLKQANHPHPPLPLGSLIALDINLDVWRLVVYPPPFTSFSVVDSRVVSIMIYKTFLL